MLMIHSTGDDVDSRGLLGAAAATNEAAQELARGGADEPIYSNLPMDDRQFREIVAEFAATIPARIEAIELALGQSDFSSLASLAHGLKGGGGMAGFPALAGLSAQLEETAKRLQRDEAAGLIDQLRTVQSRIVT